MKQNMKEQSGIIIQHAKEFVVLIGTLFVIYVILAQRMAIESSEEEKKVLLWKRKQNKICF